MAIATPDGQQQTELAEPDYVPSLYGEFAQYLPPGGSMGTELDVASLLTRAGFVDVTNTSIEVCIEVPDGQTYWDWTLTHGSRAFADDLPADRRAEFRDRMLAQLGSQKVITLQRAASVWTARRPIWSATSPRWLSSTSPDRRPLVTSGSERAQGCDSPADPRDERG